MQYNNIFKRSLAENLLSFFIFLSISLLFQSLIIWIASYSSFNFINNKYLFHKIYIVLYSFYFILLAASSWIVWKNHNLKNLKLEISIFATIAFLSVLWNYIFFKQSYFFSLIILLFTLFFSIILNLLLWKKEKIAALFFSIASTWSLYLFIINMSISAAKGIFL